MSRAPASWAFPYRTGTTYPDATSSHNHSSSEGLFCIEVYADSFDQSRESTRSALRLGVYNNVKWPNGRTITVCFLNGSAYLQSRVKDIASEWMRYANIKFQFVQGRNAEIRIQFTNPGGPSYSYLGTNNLSISPYRETMALGIGDRSAENTMRGTILHEFGHALGCVHEHSQPNFPLTWNENFVIAAHAGIWDAQKVRDNIFKRFNHWEVQASSFDFGSIMLYPIRPGWTREGYVTQENSNLSQRDREFIARMYTFPSRPPTNPTHPPQPPRPTHPTYPPPPPTQPATSNICGNPSCGQTFICAPDYNRIVRPQGYPGVPGV